MAVNSDKSRKLAMSNTKQSHKHLLNLTDTSEAVPKQLKTLDSMSTKELMEYYRRVCETYNGLLVSKDKIIEDLQKQLINKDEAYKLLSNEKGLYKEAEYKQNIQNIKENYNYLVNEIKKFASMLEPISNGEA